MGYSTFVDSSPSPTLVGLSDLYFFHIPSSTWRLPNSPSPSSLAFAPIQRYAHISAVTANRLVVVGGQDVNAEYVQDIGVFDLQREEWIASQGMEGGIVEERGMYRSACVAGEKGRKAEEKEGSVRSEIMIYSNYNVSLLSYLSRSRGTFFCVPSHALLLNWHLHFFRFLCSSRTSDESSKSSNPTRVLLLPNPSPSPTDPRR